METNLAGRIPSNTAVAERANSIAISCKKIYQFLDEGEKPTNITLSYEYMHTMERVVRTTCALGFMLRNLKYELCSHFTDELLVRDRFAKAIGNPTLLSRANLGACIGIGNPHFYKNSIFWHIYLLIQVIMEESTRIIMPCEARIVSNRLEELISQPATYSRLNCFPREISAERLTNAAKEC